MGVGGVYYLHLPSTRRQSGSGEDGTSFCRVRRVAACRLCPEWEFQSSNIPELTEQHRWTTDYWLSGVRERRRRKPLQRTTQGSLVGTELSLMEVMDITILHLKLHRTTHTHTHTHAQISACIAGEIQMHSGFH